MARNKKFGAKKSSPVSLIITALLVAGILAGVVFIAFSLNKNNNVKQENIEFAQATAQSIADVAEIRKTNPSNNGQYPATLADIPAVIPEYQTVTYTNDDNKGYCIIVEDTENRIKVTYDSLAGGMNKTGGACK